MPGPRLLRASAVAAIVGLVTITVYLVLERAVAAHLPIALCLRELLQWDASNAYGVRAFNGGWPTAFVGLAMDFVVSFAWAVAFAALYVMLPIVRRYVVLAGLCFGALVMIAMLFVVVPLGHATQLEPTLSHLANVLVAHAIFFGVPVALTIEGEIRREARLR
ncbi:MAG: hypothetical protein JOZ77_03010 [Candidatus Eremiobacteraeota bacterium]|nr:hypothetical protein [Candidatus Eremiobacteraeota bacterium]